MEPLHPDDPRQIEPFVLLGRLGSGGMGQVYLGCFASGRRVAVKRIHRHLLDYDLTFRERFRREIEAATAVGGIWTPAMAGSDAEADPPWYASDYIDAPDLHAVVSQDGPLDLRCAVALGAGLAVALAEIRKTGLVHRDLKPSNVLMAADGPRVIDFGIVRVLQDRNRLTGSGVRLLSLGYAPPEQMLGRPVTPASDVFALGALMVFATTRHLPYPGDTELAVARRMDHPADLTGAPGPLHPALRRCLAADPDQRPSPAQLLVTFDRIARDTYHDSAIGAAPAAQPRPTRVETAPRAIRGRLNYP